MVNAQNRDPNVRVIMYFTSPDFSHCISHRELNDISQDDSFCNKLNDRVKQLPKAQKRKRGDPVVVLREPEQDEVVINEM